MTEHQLWHFLTDDDGIGLCGCGRPQEGARLVRDILNLCPLYDNRPAFETLIPHVGAQMLLLGLLDNAGLIEHGGGIGGSWLTEKGIEVRDSFATLSEEVIDEMFDNERTFGEAMNGCKICQPDGAAGE